MLLPNSLALRGRLAASFATRHANALTDAYICAHSLLERFSNERLVRKAWRCAVKTEQANALKLLRTELLSSRHTAIERLRIQRERIRSDLERLDRRILEEISTLRNTVGMDINQRKIELGDEATGYEWQIRDRKAAHMRELARIRVEMERMKWQSIRNGIITFIATAVSAGSISYFYSADALESSSK